MSSARHSTTSPSHHLALRRRWLSAAVASACCIAGPASAGSYLEDLLNATPAGGWVRANLNTLSSVFITDPSLIRPEGSGMMNDPASVVHAWSSVAWDSKRQNLLLWGGGHASHSGNEMYVWQGATGTWTLGSLPSRLEVATDWDKVATGTEPPHLVVDSAAPQASHTYESNLYLPVNDRFVTFGAVAYNDAKNFKARDANGNIVLAGPWLWDPAKADATKVGGTTGSGWNPLTQGGQMWTNRVGQSDWVGPGAPAVIDFNFINNTTAYRQENGHDVVYITANGGGGWPTLYKFTAGNLAAGERDSWQIVGVSANAYSFQASGTIDALNNLYVHTTTPSNNGFDLNVWDLSKSGMGNLDVGIRLVRADGTDFVISDQYAINYSDADGFLYLWSGQAGTVYRTQVTRNADGSLATTWTVDVLSSATTAQPVGNFWHGVMGKWQYVAGLNAFVALDEYAADPNNPLDAGVWFYKPTSVSAVPEPATWAIWLSGLALLGGAVQARRRRTD